MKWGTALLIAAVALVQAVWAEDPAERQPAKIVNELIYPEALGITAARLLSNDGEKRETGRRMTDAIIITSVATELIKRVTVSPRPHPYNQRQRHAFPSGHASLAFTVAAALSEREDNAKYLAYSLAAVSGWARHDLKMHTSAQVLGGAALGTWIGHLAGEGKIRIIGHKDDDLVPSAAAEHEAALSRGRGVPVWTLKF
ncbi:MAG: phosphatase PAP2 family protein [Armatimonadia bacterium]